MLLQPSFLLILQLLILRVSAAWNCSSLLSLQVPNVTISDAVHLAPGTTFNASADPTCFLPTYNNTAPICRVIGSVNTSSTSSVAFEMWLPDTWYGRVLTGGNGGLTGCVGYQILDQGSALNFATIATNNGHDGSLDPTPFLLPERIESVIDFTWRSIYVAANLAKGMASTYYGTAPHHSYYNGCSAGGRQGISLASRYPNLFDGVLAGTPAIDWNKFIGAPGIWAEYVAANTSSAIEIPSWISVVTPEILKQCDGIDGLVDGIITDTSLCKWDPSTLLCAPNQNVTTCLTQDQISGLKKFYAPTYGTEGELLVPGYEPGAEADIAIPFPMNGVISALTEDWFNYAIYGDPTRPFTNFSVVDIEYADTVDPVGISTWDNAVKGLGEFGSKGGKLITFHGTRDPVVPSSHSKDYHNLLEAQLSTNKTNLDDFYRLFMIPGMGHCVDGPGAWRIGQGAVAGVPSNGLVNDTEHSVLLSLVEWVEGGKAPEVIIGTDNNNKERKHCLWPNAKSVWNGTVWDCVPA